MAYYHFNPPKRSDYRNDDAFIKALEEWEEKEEEYADDKINDK